MAGLLDSLFDPSAYGGSGGLLARLQPLLADVQQSQGFPDSSASFADRFNAIPNAPQPVNPQPRQFDSATFDPATYAPNQAQPISVGGYQMPRIGSADLYQPQATDMSAQSRLPPNAQPTQGMLPQAAPQSPGPAFANSDQPGFMTAYQNLKGGGGLIGSLYAGMTGQRTDPTGIQQNNLKAQFEATRQALLDNGYSPQQAASTAMLSVLNPEAAKTVLPEALSNRTDLKLIKDEFGAEHPYNYNKNTGELKPLSAGGGASAGAGSMQQTISNLDNMPPGATQDQRLAQVPQAYRGYVKSLLAGEALPSNIGRSQLRGPLMTLAHAVDPSFDETKIPLRFKTATDYAPNGQSGKSIVALNTVQHHIGQLSDALDNKDLGDTGWTFLNRIRNGIAQNTPLDKTQGLAIKRVQDAMTAVEDEMANAYKAGRISDSEIQRWHALTNTNLPLPQLKQGLADFVGLLNGKRDQLNETHQAILGKDAPGINRELNEAITKRVNDRNSDRATASSKPQTVIQNGHTYTLQPDGSYK